VNFDEYWKINICHTFSGLMPNRPRFAEILEVFKGRYLETDMSNS